ncbi:hypothetical protein E2C01_077912 [Portunus trituberculatus]|uniref:Uncharacterized protein n=1 Tax=Portunus trituberculatus TaxID=210409 RepID=A0A5B7IFN1_PORTR|nr:hypothetical protein [Portunus trituberculatus]
MIVLRADLRLPKGLACKQTPPQRPVVGLKHVSPLLTVKKTEYDLPPYSDIFYRFRNSAARECTVITCEN